MKGDHATIRKTNVHFVDCLIAATATAQNTPVASFDQDFRKFTDVRVATQCRSTVSHLYRVSRRQAREYLALTGITTGISFRLLLFPTRASL